MVGPGGGMRLVAVVAVGCLVAGACGQLTEMASDAIDQALNGVEALFASADAFGSLDARRYHETDYFNDRTAVNSSSCSDLAGSMVAGSCMCPALNTSWMNRTFASITGYYYMGTWISNVVGLAFGGSWGSDIRMNASCVCARGDHLQYYYSDPLDRFWSHVQNMGVRGSGMGAVAVMGMTGGEWQCVCPVGTHFNPATLLCECRTLDDDFAGYLDGDWCKCPAVQYGPENLNPDGGDMSLLSNPKPCLCTSWTNTANTFNLSSGLAAVVDPWYGCRCRQGTGLSWKSDIGECGCWEPLALVSTSGALPVCACPSFMTEHVYSYLRSDGRNETSKQCRCLDGAMYWEDYANASCSCPAATTYVSSTTGYLTPPATYGQCQCQGHENGVWYDSNMGECSCSQPYVPVTNASGHISCACGNGMHEEVVTYSYYSYYSPEPGGTLYNYSYSNCVCSASNMYYDWSTRMCRCNPPYTSQVVDGVATCGCFPPMRERTYHSMGWNYIYSNNGTYEIVPYNYSHTTCECPQELGMYYNGYDGCYCSWPFSPVYAQNNASNTSVSGNSGDMYSLVIGCSCQSPRVVVTYTYNGSMGSSWTSTSCMCPEKQFYDYYLDDCVCNHNFVKSASGQCECPTGTVEKLWTYTYQHSSPPMTMTECICPGDDEHMSYVNPSSNYACECNWNLPVAGGGCACPSHMVKRVSVMDYYRDAQNNSLKYARCECQHANAWPVWDPATNQELCTCPRGAVLTPIHNGMNSTSGYNDDFSYLWNSFDEGPAYTHACQCPENSFPFGTYDQWGNYDLHCQCNNGGNLVDGQCTGVQVSANDCTSPNFLYSTCAWSSHDGNLVPLSWGEFLSRADDWQTGALCSGGMGDLTTSRFKVWVCDAYSPCANLDSTYNGTHWSTSVNPFCFLYDENSQSFCPWGMASDLGLDDQFFMESF